MKSKKNKNNLYTIYLKLYLFLLIFHLKYNLKNCQISDDFVQGTLETGNDQLIDITDYNNLKVFVTTSRKIYQDIPPVLKSETSAQLINTTSIITLNENYLLAACLGNSLLARIKKMMEIMLLY